MADFAPDWSAPFWRHVCPEALSGCWLWHGGVNVLGYGRIRDGARGDALAHRIAWRLVAAGTSQRETASAFGIHPSMVSLIVTGKRWTHAS